MTDYTDLVNWLRDNAIGVVSFRPKFIEAANAIEEQAARIAEIAEQYNRARLTTFSAEMLRDATDETVQLRARIAALEALVKELADTLETYVCAKYVGKNGCPTAKRGEYDDAVEPIRKARMAIAVNNQLKVDSSLSAEAKKDDEPMSNEDWERTAFLR